MIFIHNVISGGILGFVLACCLFVCFVMIVGRCVAWAMGKGFYLEQERRG
jgi:hypothetical protein